MKPGQSPTFEVIPAVDILGGKCVRLSQGRYEDVTVYYDHPLEAAKRWVSEGAERLHVVDLDGARTGVLQNGSIIQEIIRTIPIKVQVGGGIRSHEAAQEVLSWGADRVVLGTAAVANPKLIRRLCQEFPGHMIVSLDAHESIVASEGWLKGSGKTLEELIPKLVDLGVPRLIYTDIQRDGMLEGPNLVAIEGVASQSAVPIIASGGISSPMDIQKLKERASQGVEGCIVGKALYDGRFRLADLLT